MERRREFKKAARTYEKALASSADHGVALCHAAALHHYELGNFDTAGRSRCFVQHHIDFCGSDGLYARAISADVADAPTYSGFILLLLHDLGNTERASRVLESAKTKFPKNAEIIYCHGLICLAKGNAGKAERLFGEALERNPTHGGSLSHLATLLFTVRNNVDAAESLYRRALKVWGSDLFPSLVAKHDCPGFTF